MSAARPSGLFDADLSLTYLVGADALAAALHGLGARVAPALDRPVFVIGCPRSGTTLVGACLQAHRQLRGGEESLFLIDMWRLFADLGRGMNARGWAPLAAYCSPRELLDACGAFADSVFGGLTRDGSRYVDHTPWYALLVPFIDLLYPTALFVHVIRDGRQVCLSLERSFTRGFGWAGDSISARAALWATTVRRARAAASKLPAHRYLELRYEQLSAAPHATLAGLLEFVGVAWDDAVLGPLAAAHADPSRAEFSLARVDADGSLTVTPRPFDGNWPRGWSDAQCGEFTRVVGDLARELAASTSTFS